MYVFYEGLTPPREVTFAICTPCAVFSGMSGPTTPVEARQPSAPDTKSNTHVLTSASDSIPVTYGSSPGGMAPHHQLIAPVATHYISDHGLWHTSQSPLSDQSLTLRHTKTPVAALQPPPRTAMGGLVDLEEQEESSAEPGGACVGGSATDGTPATSAGVRPS